jgi:hypothetical protein
MGWKDLLQANEDDSLVTPWVGEGSIRTFDRTWKLKGRRPPEHGWHQFRLEGRKAIWVEPAEAPMGALRNIQKGYLVGDLFVPENAARVEPKIGVLAKKFGRTHLVEPGLDKFVRVSVGQSYEDGPFIFEAQEFPTGSEEAVLQAFLDGSKSVNDIPGVTPALDVAFQVECWWRAEEVKRREEERKRREAEERRQRILEQIGTGEGRRLLAFDDFEEGARAALAVSGAQFLDHRKGYNHNEYIVRFRLNGRRFECVCDAFLRIIDAGICLVNHGTGERGDTRFTLESLPTVILEAQNIGALVVFRHVD